MSWDWLESRILSTLISFITLISLFIIIPIRRHVVKMRTNELEHLDKKINSIAAGVARLETKFDDHIDYHLNHRRYDHAEQRQYALKREEQSDVWPEWWRAAQPR